MAHATPGSTGFTVEVADWDSREGAALRDAQREELVGRYEGDVEPGAKPTAADVSVFLLARTADGAPAGCGALRHLEGEVAEIKRMFVAPQHRGRGISRLILTGLEEQALARGWRVLRLETGRLQPEALGLYASAGYVPIPKFGPYVNAAHSLCFERRLVPQDGGKGHAARRSDPSPAQIDTVLATQDPLPEDPDRRAGAPAQPPAAPSAGRYASIRSLPNLPSGS
jgi:GNAT superfamily N-acetyltransferase